MDHRVAVTHVKELMRLESEGARAPIIVGPYTTYLLIGTLQLATRHPFMSPVIKEVINDIISQLKTSFEGTPLQELLDQGDNPEFDV